LFGPWSDKWKGQNDEMYSKLLIVFITLIAAKLVISQIHLNASGPSGSNILILEQFAEANDITQG